MAGQESLPGQMAAESEAVDAAAKKAGVASDVLEGEFQGDGVEENGEDEDLKTFSDDEDVNAELEAFYEIILETFNEIDTENSGYVSVEQLGTLMDQLLEEGVLEHYESDDLEMLAADMDADGSGYIPLDEFIDVIFRREQGYIVHAKSSAGAETTFHHIGKAPIDFTEKELEEAFKVFDVTSKGAFGAKEIRGVMQAIAETEVRALDARKMIEAAATTSTPEMQTINFEEFKKIINWTPQDEEE